MATKTCILCEVAPSREGNSWCAECAKAYGRAYMKERRTGAPFVEAERVYAKLRRQNNLDKMRAIDRDRTQTQQIWLNQLKSAPCLDCLGLFPPCCMDFDHVRGPKAKGIGEMLTYSKEIILAEIAKCDLVCACCHRVRTHPQRHATKNPSRARYYAKVDALKDVPCLDCGGCFQPVAMDFDHIRGEKIATVAQMRSMPWARALLEIAKCELVCANCHRIRTQQRMPRAA